MKLLVIALLLVALTVLTTITVLAGYRHDQHVIRWFPGTGIAAKIDVLGLPPAYVSIDDLRTGDEHTFAVADDGTVVAPLPPDVYRLQLPGDGRVVALDVPRGDCLDLILDYRFPAVVLRVAREGWPMPAIA